MVGRLTSASVCAFLLLTAPAFADDECVNPGGTGGCFATIQEAIDEATTVDGDTITVEAGTYVAGQTLVNKGVTIDGAGPGLTIVDGGAGPTGAGTFRVTSPSDVTIKDLALRNPAGSSGARYALAVKSPAGAALTFDGLSIEGRASGDYGMYADNSGADVELMNSSIRNTANNPILVELHDGAMDIHDNVIDGGFSIFFMTYNGKDVTKPQRVADNAIRSSGSAVSFNSALTTTTDGRFSDVEISGNTIETGTPATGVGSGISLTNSRATADGAGGLISGVKITDNRLAWVSRPPNPVVTGSRGISLTGRVEGTEITGNSAVGYETGLRAIQTGTHGQSGTEATFNRFAGQTTAVNNATANAIGAEHNWWGCNEGPGNPGCGNVTGSGAVDTDPWLVLSASAAPASIQTGGQTSTITAHLRQDSDGATPAGNAFPDPATIGFTTSLGFVGSSADTTDAAASSVLASGADDGTATVSASLDSETVSVPVTFTRAPAPQGTTTTTVVTVPGGQAETPAATPLTLSLERVRSVRVDRRGDFIVTTNTTGRGVLVGKGTTSGGGKSGRLRGHRKTSPGGRVRLRLRVGKAARQRLAAGGRVNAQVTVSLTPQGGGTPITAAMNLRLVQGG